MQKKRACGLATKTTDQTPFQFSLTATFAKWKVTKMSWTNSVPIHLGFWLYLFAGGQIYFQIENSAYLQPPSPKRGAFKYDVTRFSVNFDPPPPFVTGRHKTSDPPST